MGRRVGALLAGVAGAREDDAVLHDERAHGHVGVERRAARREQRGAHEAFVGHVRHTRSRQCPAAGIDSGTPLRRSTTLLPSAPTETRLTFHVPSHSLAGLSHEM